MTEPRPIGRPSKLTPEVQTQICTYIRAGAFEWVAAQACGISPSTFKEWMRRGTDREDSDRPNTEQFAAFANEVAEARAQARLSVEVEVRKKNPEFWLRNGPGKTKPGMDGWTDESKQVLVGADDGPITVVNFDNATDATAYLRAIAKESADGNTIAEE